jgi:hypothetical protein
MCTSDSEADSSDKGLQLGVLVDLVLGGLLDVQDLASQGENCLKEKGTGAGTGGRGR